MPQQVGKFDFTGIPAAGTPPQGQTPPAPPAADFEGIPQARGGYRAYNMMFDALKSLVQPDNWPAIGGAAGGIVGGVGGTVAGMGVGGAPGAIGGATLGGAAGEAFRQIVQKLTGQIPPGTATDAAAQIGTQGAVQGATEAVGGLAAKGAMKAGRAMVEHAVRPTQSLLKEFPTAVDTIVREGLPVGAYPGSPAGSVQAGEKLGAAGQHVRALLDKAQASGTHFTADQVANPVLALVDDISKQPLAAADEKRLADMLDQFLAEHPGPLTPRAVKDLKDRAWAIARPVLKAEQRGQALTADQAMSARFNRALGTGAKDALETIPGVREGEKLAQELIGAKRALTQAEQRRLSLMAEGVSGLAGVVAGALGPGGGADERTRNAAVAWLTARGLTSPRTISRVGLQLTSRQAKELVRQFPRLAAAVILKQGQPAEEDRQQDIPE